MRAQLWLLIAATGVASCSGANMMPADKNMDGIATAKGPPPPLEDDPRTKVDKLQSDLVAHREALSLPTRSSVPESCDPVCAVEDPPDKPSRTAGCAPATGATCTTACKHADAACDDAAQICSIAKDLQTDALVAGRCRDARATCADAHAPCCECKAQ